MSSVVRKDDCERDFQVNALLPESYMQALDNWIANQGDKSMNRSDALRAILAAHLELPVCRTYRRRPSVFEQIDEEERIFALYKEIGSYKATAQHEQVTPETIRRKIARRARRLRNHQVELKA